MKSEEESTLDGLREQGWTEDQIMQILSLGGLADEKDGLQRQFDQADTLRNTPGPEGRHVGNGRIFVAQSPLEQIGHTMKQYQGNKIGRNAEIRSGEIRDEQAQKRMEYLRRKQSAQPVAPQGPVAMPGAPNTGPQWT